MRLTSLKDIYKALVHYNCIDLFPLKKNVSGYNLPAFKGDIRAGLNVALLAFPQGIAYAMIAGLPIEYGIYGSIAAAVIGTFFAGNRFITLGPTNATAVMLSSSFATLHLTDPEKLCRFYCHEKGAPQ